MSWVKIIHLLCVMGWMTSIFAVPRAIIYWKREHARLGENGPLGDLTFRLYRFSFGLGVIAIITGVWYGVWLGWPAWLHLKATLVVLLAAHYLWTGRLVRRAQRGVFTESDMYLRIFNEVSVIGTIAILWVVVAQPF
ncbi:CopD family protein [Mameliella alba]|uniref:Protoporphyrinogen IX oxidase n=1 Tax=Mameliella alba TaxID=561184 RepID=A0A0B3S9Y0_9RHOB|nr:CopD family protein [Mameliella alba]KHQ53456.1 Membrane protein [Mameliella alba]